MSDVSAEINIMIIAIVRAKNFGDSFMNGKKPFIKKTLLNIQGGKRIFATSRALE